MLGTIFRWLVVLFIVLLLFDVLSNGRFVNKVVNSFNLTFVSVTLPVVNKSMVNLYEKTSVFLEEHNFKSGMVFFLLFIIFMGLWLFKDHLPGGGS